MKESIDPKKIQFFQETLIKWEMEHFADFPWRNTNNSWHALVAEIMLQRTNADQVVPAFKSFSEKYQTPADYLSDENSNVFKNLGLKWREELLHKLANELTTFGGIPEEKEELLKLPGIGEYIAAAYRSLHMGKKDTIIDSNVVRLYGRFFGFKTDPETRRKKWFVKLAQQVTPAKNFKMFNYGLIDFTRGVCRPSPECNKCNLRTLCISTISI